MAHPVKAMTVDPRRNTCSVLQAPGSQQISLDLCFDWPPATAGADDSGEGYIAKLMVREGGEEASKTLERIRMLCPPSQGVGKKKGVRLSREGILAACPPIRALGTASSVAPGGQLVELDASLPNEQFLPALRELYIGTQKVDVLFNPPAITTVYPLPRAYVGQPLFCRSPVVVGDNGSTPLVYEWCAVEPSKAAEETQSAGRAAPADNLRRLSNDALIYPTEDLVGKHLVLRLSVNPSLGPWINLRTPAPVMPLPPPVARWSETPTFLEAASAFRVVSYNILYDGFCDTKACRERIYPFASPDVLSIENRQVRILQELMAYHADVICLQECGKQLFSDYLLPSMQVLGYDGLYVNKSGNVQEGCALLFRSARFALVEQQDFPLNWTTLEARYPALASRVARHEELKVALSHLTTIASLSLLRERNTGKQVVVGNTHLFYHANGCHIRMLQAFMVLDAISKIGRQTGSAGDLQPSAASSAATEAPSIVLCGDFNCTHPTGAYRLLTTGQVEGTHRSWEKGKLFWWGCDRQLGYSEEEFETLTGKRPNDGKRAKREVSSAPPAEEVADASLTAEAKALAERPPLTECFHEDLRVPIRLADAYDRTDPSLMWTNYTMTFREVIDYILFSSNLDVLRTVPIPPESELSENFALPNNMFPSDHVALIADLTFRD